MLAYHELTVIENMPLSECFFNLTREAFLAKLGI